MKPGHSKPADTPQFAIVANTSRHGLVYVAIGSGTDGYSITPHRADEIAAQLNEAAAAARAAQT